MRIAVLGAGVTGLVAARRLGIEGHRVDVYERWPGLGGQVATIDVGGGALLERYYHHLFTTDLEIVGLYEELGMAEAIEWRQSSVAIFTKGASHAFTTPLDLLRFSPLPLRSRLRMGLAVLRLQRGRGGVGPFEGMTAHEWIVAEMGQKPWDVVWGPLLRAKFGDRAEQISMAWLWSKLTLRRRLEGREARGEQLGYPRGGWQPLLEKLREEITARDGRVFEDRPARSLARTAGRSIAVAAGAPDSFRRGHDPQGFEPWGDPESYEAVLATLPSDIFGGLLDDALRAEVGADFLSRVESSEYHAAICLLLELDRRFGDFYWTNIADPEVPFIGLIEQTNFIEPVHYGGRRFLYVANYVAQDDPLLQLEMDDLLAHYTPGLRRVNPDFDPSWIMQSWLFREPAAQPIVTVGYRQRMPPLRTGAPGLMLANTTQIYPEDRGTNYSVRLGEQAARELLANTR